MDINLGCSGYVYGLWVAACLLQATQGRMGLVLVGDTISKIVDPEDPSIAPLFGDAGTATVIEHTRDLADQMGFVLGSDGRGAENLIVRGGGFRHPLVSAGASTEPTLGGSTPSRWLAMNGAEIFTFTLRQVPGLVETALRGAGWTLETCDRVVFHQANGFMLEYLRKKLGIPRERFVLGLRGFGNTSSASIPLAIVTELRGELRDQSLRLLLAGFGVGYSWGAATVRLGPLTIPSLIEVGKA
jgi:3-oxoacyl-[acyl-carrier-protein] synthase-3